jgi:hypothetical protein
VDLVEIGCSSCYGRFRIPGVCVERDSSGGVVKAEAVIGAVNGVRRCLNRKLDFSELAAGQSDASCCVPRIFYLPGNKGGVLIGEAGCHIRGCVPVGKVGGVCDLPVAAGIGGNYAIRTGAAGCGLRDLELIGDAS